MLKKTRKSRVKKIMSRRTTTTTTSIIIINTSIILINYFERRKPPLLPRNKRAAHFVTLPIPLRVRVFRLAIDSDFNTPTGIPRHPPNAKAHGPHIGLLYIKANPALSNTSLSTVFIFQQETPADASIFVSEKP